MATVSIKYRNIPLCLQLGEFYRSLESDDQEGVIEVPLSCFAWQLEKRPNYDQFHKLVKVVTFWMLDELPVGILHFCSKNHFNEWREATEIFPASLQRELQVAYMYEGVPLMDVATFGRWEIVKDAVRRVQKSSDATCIAAAHGNIPLLRLLRDEGFDWHENTCAYASQFGHLECLQFAHSNGSPLNGNVYLFAADKGHTACMAFAYSQGLRDWHPDVCSRAARHGHITYLQYALAHGCPWDENTILGSINGGHVHILDYLLLNGCPQGKGASDAACQIGCLPALQRLHHFGGDACWTVKTAALAASFPRVECLKYLHENGCPWNETALQSAVANGQYYCLRYAMERGCLYSDNLLRTAAQSSSVDCLLYLVDQGTYMDENVFLAALLYGDFYRLQYLVDQGCPYIDARFSSDKDEVVTYNAVYKRSNSAFLYCVEYMIDRGWTPDDNFIQFLSNADPQHCTDIIGSKAAAVELPPVQRRKINYWVVFLFLAWIVLTTLLCMFTTKGFAYVMLILFVGIIVPLPLYCLFLCAQGHSTEIGKYLFPPRVPMVTHNAFHEPLEVRSLTYSPFSKPKFGRDVLPSPIFSSPNVV